MTTTPPGERDSMQIECNEATGAPVFWLMAVTLPLLGFAVLWFTGVPLRFDVPARDFNPLVFFPVIGSVAGLFFFVAAVFMTQRLRKFGRSTLTLHARPRVGGRLSGHVTSTADFVPSSEWRFVLQCIETMTAAGGNGRVYRTELMRWEGTSTQPAQGLRGGVPVDIAIPESALDITDPVERARQKRGTLRWVLRLEGRAAGLDYLSSFAVPVTRRDERAD